MSLSYSFLFDKNNDLVTAIISHDVKDFKSLLLAMKTFWRLDWEEILYLDVTVEVKISRVCCVALIGFCFVFIFFLFTFQCLFSWRTEQFVTFIWEKLYINDDLEVFGGNSA